MRSDWIRPAVIIFILVTVGVNMLAMGYIAMRAQRDANDMQEECHQLEDLIRLINERLPVRTPER